MREALKQDDGDPRSVMEQMLILVAVAEGAFDDVPFDRVPDLERKLRHRAGALPEVRERIERGERLTDGDVQAIVRVAKETR